MRPEAILFDFDGVLIDSEWASNTQIADFLTAVGHPTHPEDAIEHFMGLAGTAFEEAIERWIDGPLPDGFNDARMRAGARYMRDGIAEVAGATRFIRSLVPDLPIAVVSSASVQWIAAHLDHLDIRERFNGHLYSGREHVERMKPAPDIYLFAAGQLGVDIRSTLVIEDSPVGVTGAVASGAQVIGLCAGSHIRDGHDARLTAAGAHRCVTSFEEIARLIG